MGSQLILDFENGKIYRLFYGTGGIREVGSKDRYGYLQFCYEGRKITCHRFLYERYYNVKLTREQYIDHMDRNPRNNSIKNLRVVSNQQNSQNRTHNKNSKTGHKNIFWNKQKQKYEVQIMLNGKSKRFGFFTNIEDAIVKRDEAIKELNSQGHIFSC
jgi:hypothetical protein